MDHQLYDFEVLTKADDLAGVTREWNALAEQFGTPLLEGDWFTACAETLCDESDLCVVIVRSKGAIRAVAPLVIVRRDGVEWLEILGARYISRDLNTVREPNSSNFAQGGVWFLGGRGIDPGANSPALWTPLQSRTLRLVTDLLSASSNQLIEGWQTVLSLTACRIARYSERHGSNLTVKKTARI